MTTTDVLKLIISKDKITLTELGKKTKRTRANVSQCLDRKKSMRIDTLAKLLDAVGGELIIRYPKMGNAEWKIDLKEEFAEKEN